MKKRFRLTFEVVTKELLLAENAMGRALRSTGPGQSAREDAAYARLMSAERAVDRSLGIDPDARMEAAYERQQRAACLSDACLSEVSHDPR